LTVRLLRPTVATAAVAAVDVVALVRLPPPSAALAGHLAAPHRWLAEAGTDRALAELAGAAIWVAAAWLALGLLAVAAAGFPGVTGRAADRLARGLLPAAVRALVAGSAGLGVLVAPVAALAHAPDPLPAPAGPAVAAPAWPVTGPPSPAPTRSAPTPSAPTPSAPTGTGTAPSSRPPVPRPPVPRPRGPRPPAAPTPPTARPLAEVTVHPGDSLWTIAADHLGLRADRARVARAWPHWFAANRRVIGVDPDLIRPGQVLRVPSPSTAEEAS
jgi:LysM repeat protein